MKKVIAFFLLLAVTASYTACSDGGADTGASDTGGDSQSGDTASSDEDLSDEIKGLAAANLPNEKFGGENFTFLSPTVAEYAWWYLDVDEITGEPLNDAIYNRNKKIEETFGVEIDVVKTSNFANDIQNAVNSGDASYSAAFGPVTNQLSLAQSGYLRNLCDITYIDLDREWWDESLTRDMTLLGKLYFACGDISPSMNMRVYSLVFNKDLCRDLGLELPYQHVLDGTWTLEVFSKYIQDVNFDVNGDSKMDYNDRWGYFSQDGNSFMMYFSGGGRIVNINKEGTLEIVLSDEKFVNLMEKALEISYDKTKTLMANDYVNKNGGSWMAASQWFAAGGSLMRSSVFEPVPRDYRTMETDFGVLPYPKFTDTQETYYTLPEAGSAYVISVPISADTERSGIILEALAAESTVTVTPAFYDVCLTGKIVRDNESEQMLDIIFGNKVFDIGYILNIGGFTGIITALEKASSSDVVSKYTASQKSSQKSLEKLIDDFMNLEH